MNKLLEKWPLMWKSTHETQKQAIINDFTNIMHNANMIDVQHEKVFHKLVELAGVELELITLPNGFQAWNIKGDK